MKKVKEMIKKTVSILVAVCLTVGVANIPVYAGINAPSSVETTQEVLIPYSTPAQAAKKVTSTKKTAATKATTKATTKKVTVSSAVNKLATRGINTINKIIKKKGISKVAKTWLRKAKTIIRNIKNGKKTNKEKKVLLNEALTSINKVSKAKASDLSLAQQSYSSKSVFSKLKNVLKNNTIYKTYAKYAKKGVDVVTGLAKKLKLSVSTTYKQFVKYGVTKEQMNKVGSLVLKLMRKGEDFVNCAALAVSKYLGISNRNFAAVQNLVADISINSQLFLDAHENGFSGTSRDAQLKTLRVNGVEANSYGVTLENFMSGLKAGEKALLSVITFSGNGHAITITKEKDGSYGVFDIKVNNGNKIIYTAANFKKLMSGKKVKVTGKTSNGKKITTTVDYKAKHKFGVLEFTPNDRGVYGAYEGLLVRTDSKGIADKTPEYWWKK